MERIVRREELLQGQLSRTSINRRLSTGQWRRLLSGIYLTADEDPTFNDLVGATMLWAPKGVISHRSAAQLLGLPKVTTDKVEVILPHRQRSHADWLITHHSEVPASDRTVEGVVPITCACRTIIDLADELPVGILEAMFDHAVTNRKASLAQFQWRLEQLPRVKGRRLIQDIIDSRVRGVPASELERELRRMLKRAKAPIGEFNYRVKDGEGVMFIDMAYPDRMVAVECQSYSFHSSKDQLQHDCDRRNRLTLLGWNVLEFTWDEITNEPEKVVATILSALRWAAA